MKASQLVCSQNRVSPAPLLPLLLTQMSMLPFSLQSNPATLSISSEKSAKMLWSMYCLFRTTPLGSVAWFISVQLAHIPFISATSFPFATSTTSGKPSMLRSSSFSELGRNSPPRGRSKALLALRGENGNLSNSTQNLVQSLLPKSLKWTLKQVSLSFLTMVTRSTEPSKFMSAHSTASTGYPQAMLKCSLYYLFFFRQKSRLPLCLLYITRSERQSPLKSTREGSAPYSKVCWSSPTLLSTQVFSSAGESTTARPALNVRRLGTLPPIGSIRVISGLVNSKSIWISFCLVQGLFYLQPATITISAQYRLAPFSKTSRRSFCPSMLKSAATPPTTLFCFQSMRVGTKTGQNCTLFGVVVELEVYVFPLEI